MTSIFELYHAVLSHLLILACLVFRSVRLHFYAYINFFYDVLDLMRFGRPAGNFAAKAAGADQGSESDGY